MTVRFYEFLSGNSVILKDVDCVFRVSRKRPYWEVSFLDFAPRQYFFLDSFDLIDIFTE